MISFIPRWRALFFLAVLSVCTASAPAETIREPVEDYLASTALPGEGLLPNRQEIHRMDMDLGDGNGLVVFLSFGGMTDRSGRIWTAYVPVKNGYQRIDHTREGGLIQFRRDFVRPGRTPSMAEKGGLIVCYPGRDGANRVLYEFRGGVATVRDLPGLDYLQLKDRKELHSLLDRDAEGRATAKYLETRRYVVISNERK